MILKRALKQVIVGAVALAYLQKAKAEVDRDILKIRDYWTDKTNYHMEREIKIRVNILNEVKTLECKEIQPCVFNKYIEEGEANLENLKTHLVTFESSADTIVEKAINIIREQMIAEKRGTVADTQDLRDELMKMLPSALDKTDLLYGAIKKFDSHMLEVIERYSKAKNRDRKIHNLTLFKLAKKNKFLAVGIVYALFNIEGPTFKRPSMKDEVDNMLRAINNYLSFVDYSDYEKAIRDDIDKGEMDLLKLADRHLAILFEPYGNTSGGISIYLDLVKENMTKKDIRKHNQITRGQVVKVIMIECAMDGYLMDYRNNTVFSNLGQIIMSIGKADDDSTDAQKDLRLERERQDRILSGLYVLWSEWENFKLELRNRNIRQLCRQNDINIDYFKEIQNVFTSARWMYDLDILTPTAEEIDDDQSLLKKVRFDMSYTHPMCYIYQRCEDMSQVADADLGSDEKPFAEKDSDSITLRLHKIGKNDSSAVQTENMKNCIRAWYSKMVKLIRRKEDGLEYYYIANDFERHLERSQYVNEVQMETEQEYGAIEQNPFPLQDNQMKAEEENMELVFSTH
ncbi:hypothetical protein NEMIN01_0360 [Nematocida minor]|uniref:uncharacterized protein n=1 Tax=Nematocida minor TaxID=1912983 RepID=UPI00221F3A58|nr:uncharacterized protein NEMIN01_0360 [Nematocida minor]KAI5189194.1 hypothetical protein NEMIN01_0360 [Nematocida minor]